MRLIVVASLIVALAEAISPILPPNHPPTSWKPAGPNEERSPCPMLNALANHGHLPHDGKNISEESTIQVLGSVLNMDKELARAFFKAGLSTNPNENAKTFFLGDLGRHGIVEHDGSLSRQDFYFGDDTSFNQAIFDQTRTYWRTPFIDIESAARARQARINTSNATNPAFNLSSDASATSYTESALILVVFGNKTTGFTRKSWVEYLFENERLPYELGWTRAFEPISLSDVGSMSERLVKATEDFQE